MNKSNIEKLPKIIAILGPTSSGKSEVAIRLAKKFNGEIISADSRQIYRDLDIGTGKVSKQEQKTAKHWMLDIINPTTKYNATKFKQHSEKIIADILQRKKLPIICGGTGFWIQAVVDNIVFPEVKPDEKLRNSLRNKTAEHLFSMLKKLDSKRANNIDAKNKVRLIRAIEICKELGSVPRIKTLPKYEALQIGIDVPKEKLHLNIEKRLRKRWQAGMIKEVKDLHKKQKLSWKKIQSFGLGYFWIPLFLQGKLSKEELFKRLYLTEKYYAKRQMTWFQKDQRIVWLKNSAQISIAVKKFLAS